MKRKIRFAVLFSAALCLALFLPLFIAPQMTRSQTTGGDVIDWGLKFTSLINYWSERNYFRPEENFFVWLAVNCLLALIYALLVALGIDRLAAYAKRRAESFNQSD